MMIRRSFFVLLAWLAMSVSAVGCGEMDPTQELPENTASSTRDEKQGGGCKFCCYMDWLNCKLDPFGKNCDSDYNQCVTDCDNGINRCPNLF